jgi:hypothetical protein
VIKLHFHADSDGVVSAFFVSGELDRLGIKHKLIPSLGSSVNFEGDGNIFLDLSSPKGRGLMNFSIDHHVSEKLKFFYANPRLSGFEWPVSFTSYALFGAKELAWVSAVGVVADWGAEKVPAEFWKVVKESHPGMCGRVKQESLVKGRLGEMALMIDCTIARDRSSGAVYSLKALKEANSWSEFLAGKGKSGAMKKARAEIMQEVNKVFGAEIVKKEFVLLRFQSPHRIKSLVAAMAKERYKNKMIVIAQDEKDKVRLSFRQGRGLDKLAKELTYGIGEGGGHPEASGGHIRKKDWETFKTRLFSKFC